MKILALILAGGTGEELSVLTHHRAKTAVPFGGRYRIIDFCLSNCVHSGITEVAILAQYSPKSLMDHIGMGKPWDLDRKSGGVYILQPSHHGEAAQWYLGTADALYQNIDLIRNSRADTVLVLSGDQVYLMDYRRIAARHAESRKLVTIAIKEVPSSQRSRFGMVRCSKNGIATEFREKPTSGSFRCASLGIYAFRRDFLLDILSSQPVNIVFDILMPWIDRRQVACLPFDGYWEDVGSIQHYYRASLRLLRDRSLITNAEWPVYTKGTNLPPAKCAGGSLVTNSIVADGCVIEGRVSGSILFPGVIVERDAVVEESILFPFVRIGQKASISRSILDKFATVRRGASVGCAPPAPGGARNDGGRESPKTGGITVIGSEACVASGFDVRRGAVVEPRARLGRGARS